jgi:hypothetical protein
MDVDLLVNPFDFAQSGYVIDTWNLVAIGASVGAALASLAIAQWRKSSGKGLRGRPMGQDIINRLFRPTGFFGPGIAKAGW